MNAKVIRTKINKDGTIYLKDGDLIPGEVDIVILYRQLSKQKLPVTDADHLPFGGYKAGWLSPDQLRREAIYEED